LSAINYEELCALSCQIRDRAEQDRREVWERFNCAIAPLRAAFAVFSRTDSLGGSEWASRNATFDEEFKAFSSSAELEVRAISSQMHRDLDLAWHRYSPKSQG